MNRVDLGKLTASLRREHEDEWGRPWTQETLAEKANLALGLECFSKSIISSIERGERGLNERTLLALADALQLTSGERREFFLAACGIRREYIARGDADPEQVLNQLLDTMQQVRLPAHIMDPHCDVLATNSAVIDLLDFRSAGLAPEDLANLRFPYNQVRLAFSDRGAEHLGKLIGQEGTQGKLTVDRTVL